MCVRKTSCGGLMFMNITFSYSILTIQITIRQINWGRNGVRKKKTEFLNAKPLQMCKKRNQQLLGSSNGRLNVLISRSQLGIPEVIEEVVHISSNKDRFAIYPMHGHAF